MTKATASITTAALTLAGMFITASALGAEDQGMLSAFSLSVSFGIDRTDNRDRVPNEGIVRSDGTVIKKEDSVRYRLSPVLSYEKQINLLDLHLFYTPGFSWIENPRRGGDKTEWHHGFNGRTSMQLTPLTQLVVSDNLWWSWDKELYYPGEFDFESRDIRNDDHYRNKFHAELNRSFMGLLKGSAGFTYTMKRYDESALKHMDEDILEFDLNLMKQQSRHFYYGLYTRYTIFDRADQKISDEELTIENGVSYWNTGLQGSYDVYGNKRLVFNARTGYNYMWYEADEIDDDEMLGDTSIDVSIFQQERIGGKLGFRYGKNYSDIFPYSSQDDLVFFGSVFAILDSDFRVGADFEYRTRSYDLVSLDVESDPEGLWKEWLAEQGFKAGGDRDSVWIRLWANYRISDHLSCNAFYSHETVNSDVDTEYKENVIGAGMTVKFF